MGADENIPQFRERYASSPGTTSTHLMRSKGVVGFCVATLVSLMVTAPGCMGGVPVPDQSQFAPLEELSSNGLAVVRLYVAPLPGLEAIATHPWFVVKRADSTTFHRWEVLERLAGPYGFVREDALLPTSDVGAGGVCVLAELIGPEAEPVVAFIEERSPVYPCRYHYAYFPGPNSNTYAQWVLDHTGWPVLLPPTAIGKEVTALCE